MNKIFYILTLALLPMLFACSKENPETKPHSTDKHRVVFSIGDKVGTRAVPSGSSQAVPALEREKKIHNLYAVVFINGGTFYKTLPVTLAGANGEFEIDKTGDFKVFLIANADDDLKNSLSTAAILSETQLANMIATQAVDKKESGSAEANFFLMTAEPFLCTVSDGEDTNAGEHALTRAAVRYDFYNRVPMLKMEKITFKQRRTQTRIATPVDMAGLAAEDKTYTSAEGLQEKECIAAIYSYENIVNNSDIVFVIEGNYNGKPIKPIEVKLDSPFTGKLQRNFLYNFIISEDYEGITPGEPGKLKISFSVIDWQNGGVITLPGSISMVISYFKIAVNNEAPIYAREVSVPSTQAEVKIIITNDMGGNAGMVVYPEDSGTSWNITETQTLTAKNGKSTQVFTISIPANTTGSPIVKKYWIKNPFSLLAESITITQEA